MKITKNYLQQVIKEEISSLVEGMDDKAKITSMIQEFISDIGGEGAARIFRENQDEIIQRYAAMINQGFRNKYGMLSTADTARIFFEYVK